MKVPYPRKYTGNLARNSKSTLKPPLKAKYTNKNPSLFSHRYQPLKARSGAKLEIKRKLENPRKSDNNALL